MAETEFTLVRTHGDQAASDMLSCRRRADVRTGHRRHDFLDRDAAAAPQRQPPRDDADAAVVRGVPAGASTAGMNLVGALLVAVLIGAMLPLQGLVNARLGVHSGGPVVAAFVSFLVGTAMLGLYLVVIMI